MAPLNLRAEDAGPDPGRNGKRTRRSRSARSWPRSIRWSINEIIDALYEASPAGVQIKLNIRGICCLRPGVNETKRATSRSSASSTAFWSTRGSFQFRQGGDKRMFISSADWMPRNLDRRIELMIPVETPACRSILDHALETCFRDNVSSWTIQPDGSSKRPGPGKRRPLRSQQELWQWSRQLHQNATNPGTTVFKPILPE